MCGPASTPPRRRPTRNGAHIVMIGILPTLMPEHLSGRWMSESTRYQALNDSIFTARGEDILIDIAGPERLSLQTESIAPESACTSMQLHLQVSPADFAQQLERRPGAGRPAAGAGRQLAVLLRPPAVGRDPHRAVRPGHRHPPRRAQDPGRAAAGVVRRTLDHLDLRPVRGERALLPVAAARAVRRGPGQPSWPRAARRRLPELRLHNGTIYRWNRPVYDVVDGRPHLRVENRVLPAGPTVRRHDGQLGVLLRHAADAVRGGPAGLDEDEFRCGRTQFPRGRTARHGRAAVLARPRRGDARRAGAAPAAADGRRGTAPLGGGRARCAIGTSA